MSILPDTSSIQPSQNAVLARNKLIEASALDTFLIRFPHLNIRVFFFYKYIKSGSCEVSDHAHHHWEITWISQGNATYHLPDRDISFRPSVSDYLIIPEKTTHNWVMNSSPFLTHSWQVRIEPEDADGEKIIQSIHEHSLAGKCLVPASSNQHAAELMLWNLSAANTSPDMAAPIFSGIARIVIGDFILRFCPKENLTNMEDDKLVYSIKQKLAKRIRQFLDDNIDRGIRMSDMESHFHYSGRHLNRIFQESYSRSIRDYLGERRLELTKRWLESSERTIKDIALSLGYRDSSQLCNYFMRRMGSTPTDYRRDIRERKAEFLQRSVKNL